MKTWYAVRVVSLLDGSEVARYSYDSRREAAEASRSLKDIRVKQNHERVRIVVEQEKLP